MVPLQGYLESALDKESYSRRNHHPWIFQIFDGGFHVHESFWGYSLASLLGSSIGQFFPVKEAAICLQGNMCGCVDRYRHPGILSTDLPSLLLGASPVMDLYECTIDGLESHTLCLWQRNLLYRKVDVTLGSLVSGSMAEEKHAW